MANPQIERLREQSYRVLTERNLKLTRPRMAIIDCLLKKEGWHFLADDLQAEVNQGQPGTVSRATVYRTLEVLTEAGVLTKTRMNENSFRYELADLEGHHHHLIDIASGKVVCFKGDEDLHRMLDRICRENGFTEQYHVLEVFGQFSKPPAPAPRTSSTRRRTGGKR